MIPKIKSGLWRSSKKWTDVCF